MDKTGCGGKGEGRFEKGRCTLTIKMECWHTSDCCLVEVNQATLTCWEYYQILSSGVSPDNLLSVHFFALVCSISDQLVFHSAANFLA